MRIGDHVVRPVDVADLDIEERVERDWVGQWMCAVGYGFASLLMLIGILLGLDWKFAIAVTFLAAVAAMSMIDALGVPAVRTFSLNVRLRDGRQVSFVDADRNTVEDVARLLRRPAAG